MKRRIRKIQLNAALDRYYETVSRFKKGAKQEFYRISTLKKTNLSEKNLNEITSIDIADYRDYRLSLFNDKTKKNISPNTVRLELALLSSLFNIAKTEWGCCSHNPVEGLRKPKISTGRTRRLSRIEENKIKKYFLKKNNIDAYCIFVLAIETAMRQGEILSLAWEYVYLNKKIIVLHDTKNGESRTVPLSDSALDVLGILKPKRSGAVVSYTSNGFKSAWRKAMIDLDICDLHFHDLRHEAISRLVELGTLNLIEIAAISGHKSMSMLKRYSHIDSGKLHSKLNKKNKTRKVEFPAYPAFVKKTDMYEVDFFDLGLNISVNISDDWKKDVCVSLLTHLARLYSNGIKPEKPSTVNDGSIYHFSPIHDD